MNKTPILLCFLSLQICVSLRVAKKCVCEGYAKAFQLLCDLTTFNNNIACYTVSGVMTGATGAGNHMWNVVHMDDENSYLVDVTNSVFNDFFEFINCILVLSVLKTSAIGDFGDLCAISSFLIYRFLLTVKT